GREPGGAARGDEHAPAVRLADLDDLGGAIGRRAHPQVVEHHACEATRHQPVVGLVEVVVQADDGPGLLVGAVALDHLATERKPGSAVRLDEAAPLVAVHLRLDDDDVGNEVGLVDLRHRRAPSSGDTYASKRPYTAPEKNSGR